MKIEEYSLISNEWIIETEKYIRENCSKYLKDSVKWKYWNEKLSFLIELRHQALSPMPLAENIFDAGVQYGAECMVSNPDIEVPNMQTFLNSDIKID